MIRDTRPHRLRGFDYSLAGPYLVTMCVLGRRPVFRNSNIAAIAVDELNRFRDNGWYWIYAFVVMPDHVHLLMRLRDHKRTLGTVVGTLKSSMLYRSRRVGVYFEWQNNFHDHIVRENERLEDCVGYIMRNPERAGLVNKGEAYPFAQ